MSDKDKMCDNTGFKCPGLQMLFSTCEKNLFVWFKPQQMSHHREFNMFFHCRLNIFKFWIVEIWEHLLVFYFVFLWIANHQLQPWLFEIWTQVGCRVQLPALMPSCSLLKCPLACLSREENMNKVPFTWRCNYTVWPLLKLVTKPLFRDPQPLKDFIQNRSFNLNMSQKKSQSGAKTKVVDKHITSMNVLTVGRPKNVYSQRRKRDEAPSLHYKSITTFCLLFYFHLGPSNIPSPPLASTKAQR